jgi:hypothetical protein
MALRKFWGSASSILLSTAKRRGVRIATGVATTLCLALSAVPATASLADTSEQQAWSVLRPATSAAQVVSEVRAAQHLKTLPGNVLPGLSSAYDAGGIPTGQCPSLSGVMAGQGCVYGNSKSKRVMVIYGDSHAQMWGEDLRFIADDTGWKLVVYALPGCQAPDLLLLDEQTGQPNTACQQFQTLATEAIKHLHPNLLVVTSESVGQTSSGVDVKPSEWQAGLTKTFSRLAEPGTSMVMIGDIPEWENSYGNCLAAHMSSVQSCAVPVADALSPDLHAEQKAATLSHVKYIATTDWACAAKCEPVIDNVRVYANQYHFGEIYIAYLRPVLEQALGLRS